MYGYDYDFGERMQEGRDNAARRRGRGLPTGKSMTPIYRPRPVDDSADHHVAVLWSDWTFARKAVIQDYRWTVYGDQWEGFE